MTANDNPTDNNKPMKLRFEVDQAAFRRGIDAPNSIVSIEINPAEIPEDDRNLIADRLDGIDDCRLEVRPEVLQGRDGNHQRTGN